MPFIGELKLFLSPLILIPSLACVAIKAKLNFPSFKRFHKIFIVFSLARIHMVLIFTSASFYNNSLTMTSVGKTIDPSVNQNGGGSYSFVLCGELIH
jgi:hypothetical protein